ncbi:MAG: DUF2510 domain-containing protein [Microbacteriaceae bacterium]|nr:DUF2510 domain-containing protein [Microbacteriaceae bacterium]
MADDDVRVPAGWYPDPLGLPQLRWWDNHAWTEHTSDARQPMVAQETVTTASPRLAYADDVIEDERAPYNLDLDDTDPDLTRRERRERERTESDGAATTTSDAAAFADPLLSLEAPAREEAVEEPSPAARFAQEHTMEDAPTSSAYDLGVRYDDLLGDLPKEAFTQAAADPRSAYAHVGESATGFVPEPAAQPMYSGYAGRVTTQIQADDIDTTTGPAWVMTLIPVYSLMAGLLLLLSGMVIRPTALALVILFGIPHLAGIVLAFLDQRILRHRGMEHPASWIWSILGAPVYLIARLTRTVRVSGQGFAPLITYLTLGAVSIGAALAAPGLIIQLNPGYFSVEAQQSVRSSAQILKADLIVNCPDTPPLLIGQSFKCSATNENQEFFNVTVSLQRQNGWIAWRVDDWGIYGSN